MYYYYFYLQVHLLNYLKSIGAINSIDFRCFLYNDRVGDPSTSLTHPRGSGGISSPPQSSSRTHNYTKTCPHTMEPADSQHPSTDAPDSTDVIPAPVPAAAAGPEAAGKFDPVTGKKLPYKSFRKKYLKMELQFTQVMARSEELHKQKLMAARVFGRLAREKKRLLDVLLGLQESGMLNKQLEVVGFESPPPEPTSGLLSEDVWNDEVKHLARLNAEMFDHTSDEDEEPVPRNPMSLIEWLRRNQPGVFTADSATAAVSGTGAADLKKSVVDKAMAGQKSGAGADAGGTDKTPTKKRKGGAGASTVEGAGTGPRSNRKRKTTSTATIEEGEPAGGTDSPAVTKSKRIKKED